LLLRNNAGEVVERSPLPADSVADVSAERRIVWKEWVSTTARACAIGLEANT